MPHDNVVGQKAECLSHFSFEKSNSKLMLLDLQGSGHTLLDPELPLHRLLRTTLLATSTSFVRVTYQRLLSATS